MKGNINLISYDCYQQATEKQLAGLKWKENRVYYISEIHNEKMQDEIYGYIDDRCRRLSLSTVVNDIYRFDLLKEFLNEKCTSCSTVEDVRPIIGRKGEYFMQNEIYDEKNGLTYMLCGDYYLPELALTDIEPTYGKYGMLRKSYLQEHRKAKYQILLLQGKLVEHLNQIDAEARDREEQLVKQMMEKEGITEELKRQDNMEWTRRMNTLCHDAEEMILTEMIYTKG